LKTYARNRDRVRFLISLVPGVHLRQVQRAVRISFSSARYHVERLERNGQIVREEDGGYTRLFPARTDRYDRMLISLLRRETDRRILVCLANHPSVTNREISELTGLAKSTISEHVTRLKDMGVIHSGQSQLGMVTHELNDPDHVALMIRSVEGSLLRKAADSFIDLWDF
jgi:predicted transcriptional regulator